MKAIFLRFMCHINLHPWKHMGGSKRNLKCRTPGCNAISGW